GFIGIETRGNASQMFDKKPYLLETRDDFGANLNISLLDMPKENDWILRAAHIDRTFIRDALALEMSRRMGRWASRTRHVELILNGDYRGVYILEESIKPDKNRLNIARMDSADIAGDDVTGGYIYDIAQTENDFGKRRQLKYPKADEVQPQQIAYIRKYDDDFRRVMEQSYYTDPVRGYAAWIDVDYFIDAILLEEACKNSDAYGWSAHFHKDRLGKLRAGPAWDYDQALSNSTFNDGPNYAEWIIEKSEFDGHLRDNHPPFWIKLFREAAFKKQLALRWFALRENVWKTDAILGIIDSTAAHLDEAQVRNFTRWPGVLGAFLWRETPGYAERDTYEKEVDYLREFITNRLSWMDAQLRRYVEESSDPVDGLVMHYDFDEPSGTIVKDKSGLYNDGLLRGNPQWTDGKYAGGISFGGADDYVDCGDPENLNIENELTIAAWVKQRDAGNDEHNPWITKGDHSFAIKHYSENQYEFFIYDGGWQTVRAPAAKEHNGAWHHFAGTYDGDNLVLYIDGERKASERFSGTINQTNDPINIGRNAEASDRFLDGVIDDVRIYNVALTDEQIRAIYNDTAIVRDEKNGILSTLTLAQNYPNPFNDDTTIRYTLSTSQVVTLAVYDLAGRLQRTCAQGEQGAGEHAIAFRAQDLASGLYLYEIRTSAGAGVTKKMLLLK
ncbi:CotH kinase family protein, partial [candidate division KSB1 bacterium]|nr:CotH kinase family protein [candidate division KSB1 bacterium]